MPYHAYLLDKLRAVVKKQPLSYHTPGHKNGRLLPPELKALWGSDFARYDLTELSGLDNLHFSSGCIAQSQQQAADIWQCRQAFYLVNGTSGGLQAAIMATCRNQPVFVPRHAHRSIYHSLILAQAQPIYLPITTCPTTGLPLGIDPDVFADYLQRYPQCRQLIMVHPTYQGLTWRGAEVLALAKDHGLTVIVDEAHGAHLHFHPALPSSLLDLGADLVVQSWHKTLPVLTQGSALLVGNCYQGPPLEPLLSLLQTTSPSYLTMASLEAGSIWMGEKGQSIINASLKAYEMFFDHLKELTTIRRLWQNDWRQDPFKLYLISDRLSGPELAQKLQDEFAIYAEMSDASGCLLILPLAHDHAELKRLWLALSAIDISSLSLPPKRLQTAFYCQEIPPQALSLTEAFYRPKRQIPWSEACGQISGDFIIKYPPGIPICVPGEIITRQLAEQWSQDPAAEQMVTIIPKE